MKSSKGFAAGKLWGELPTRETHKQEVITPDIIENVWRQVMDESNNTDCDYQIDRHPEYLQLPPGNLHVLNTVNFHQQLRSLEDGAVLGNVTVVDIQENVKTEESSNPFHFLPPRAEKVEFKDVSTIHYMRPSTAHNLLKHAVTVLLAHIGYESASDIALETLTDVGDHFLRRMSLLLKAASEQKTDEFPDAVERVLLETGVGGVAEIHDYYQYKILRYEQIMREKVEAAAEEQRQLEFNAYSSKIDLDEAASKLQFEDIDEFGNVYREVPTLQLLDPEMGFPPSLDAGFQMLHSLEQDELNSLEVDEEEINVSDSPSANQQRIELPNDKKKK